MEEKFTSIHKTWWW